MKNYFAILLAFTLVGTVFVISGCEDSLVFPTTTTTAASTTSTTLPVASQVKISGTLYAGSVGASISSIRGCAAAPSYRVVAQDTDTGEFKFVTTDSSGYFEITAPSNKTYTINIVDADTKYKGPIIADDMGSNQAAMGFITSATLEIGDIVINESSGLIAPTVGIAASFVNTAKNARTDANGVPVGVGNAGKGSTANYSGTLASGFDSDKDGLPNFVDADNDGDGVIDELDPDSGVTTEAVVDNSRIDNADVYMSLDVGYDNSQSFDPVEQSGLYFRVIPDPSVVSDIASVKVSSIPAGYANAVLIDAHTVDGVSYPDWTPWSDLDRKLGRLTTSQSLSGLDEWAIYIRPRVHPQPGDMFIFRVDYNDGSYDEFTRMVNFSFSSIPSLESYSNGGALQSAPATNEPNSPVIISGTTEVELNYVRPTDENGQTLDGFAYTYFIDLYKIFQPNWPDSEYVDTIQGTITSADDGSGSYIMLNYVLPTSYGGFSIEAYRISLRCTTPADAGNASSSLLMYFRR